MGSRSRSMKSRSSELYQIIIVSYTKMRRSRGSNRKQKRKRSAKRKVRSRRRRSRSRRRRSRSRKRFPKHSRSRRTRSRRSRGGARLNSSYSSMHRTSDKIDTNSNKTAILLMNWMMLPGSTPGSPEFSRLFRKYMLVNSRALKNGRMSGPRAYQMLRVLNGNTNNLAPFVDQTSPGIQQAYREYKRIFTTPDMALAAHQFVALNHYVLF
jgi:hypothetical protein